MSNRIQHRVEKCSAKHAYYPHLVKAVFANSLRNSVRITKANIFEMSDIDSLIKLSKSKHVSEDLKANLARYFEHIGLKSPNSAVSAHVRENSSYCRQVLQEGLVSLERKHGSEQALNEYLKGLTRHTAAKELISAVVMQ